MLPDFRAMSHDQRERYLESLAALNAQYRAETEAHGYFVSPYPWADVLARVFPPRPRAELRLVWSRSTVLQPPLIDDERADELLEELIRDALDRTFKAPTGDERARACAEMVALIGYRTPAQIARMEQAARLSAE
jgi:hypothetical protein